MTGSKRLGSTTMNRPTAESARPSIAAIAPPNHGRRKVTAARVIKSEWTKFWSVRSTYITMITAAILTVFLGMVFCAGAASEAAKMSAAKRAKFDPASASLNGFFIAQLAIALLGVVVFSSEFQTGMIRTTFTAVPRRLPVLWAKLLVFGATTFAVMALASLFAFLAGQALLTPQHLQTSLGTPGVQRVVLGSAVYLTVVGLLGVAVGAIVRRAVVGIGAMVFVLFVAPILVTAMSRATSGIGKFLPNYAGRSLMTTNADPQLRAPGAGFLVLLGYLVVFIGIAALAIRRRDV